MNFPTVDDIKKMLGILPADVTKDDAIQAQLDVVLAIIENYCDRHFALDDYEDRFLWLDARNPYLRLHARPIESITEVLRTDAVVDPGAYKVYPETGLLRQAYRGACWCGHEDQDVLVRYRGGWADGEWPADFVDVVMQMFMARWNATNGTGSYADAAGAGGTGQIKAFTVDAVRVEYDLGGGGRSSGNTNGAGVPPELAPFAAILSKYCDPTAYGV